MSNDGKQLEGLVAFVEELHLPANFSIKTNKRVFNDGVQVAEFDIEIRGKLGTTEIAWLIECRDRPSQGPAPGQWIEQLLGRRTRFQFNRVTAVSTTGFAEDAAAFAHQEGIEIRTVKNLTPEDFGEWLTFRSFPFFETKYQVKHIVLFPEISEPKKELEAFREKITTMSVTQPILRSVETNTLISPLDAFNAAKSSNSALADKLLHYQEGTKPLTICAEYPHDHAHYVVDIDTRPIRIRKIVFNIEIITTRKEVLLSRATEYAHAANSGVISQSAAFEFTAFDMNLSLEMHKLNETGQTHLIMRNLGKTQQV